MRGASKDSATRVAMVIDIVDSTRFRIECGDAVTDALLVAFERLVDEAATADDGRVVANHGDGFLTSFGSASNALHAAAVIRSRVAALQPRGVAPPELRIGLSAGDVVERGREMYGLPVVIAARLESAAEPGEIVCSDLVRSLAGSRSEVDFVDGRDLSLKGIPEDIRVWTVSATVDFDDRAASHQVLEWRDEIPIVADRFFGRVRELEELPERIRSGRIVTLLGPGGVGKTRLSLEVAQVVKGSFPDGVWFVELEAARSVDDVVSAVARTLRLPNVIGNGSAADVAASLRSLDALVVLDNCEQAVDGAAQVARSLTAEESGIAVLTSSREVLGLRSELVWPVEPLPTPDALDGAIGDAVALFVDRAEMRHGPGVIAEGDLDHVRSIVSTLEGLPLAIELAASRLNVLTAQAMAERSEGLVAVLAQRDRDRPGRHQTLAATVDWSVGLLDADERSLLVTMAAFAGGSDLDTVDAIVGESTVDGLAALVDKSLLRRQPDGRFQMLSVIREVVRERSDTADQLEIAGRAHADHFAALARQGSTLVQHDPDWLTRFVLEHGNLTIALDRLTVTDPARALRMAGNLALYWVLSGNAVEGDRRFAQVLDAAHEADPAVLASALRGAGMAAALGGRYERSAELFLDARERYRQLDRGDAAGYCDHWLARNAVVQCHFGLAPVADLEAADRRLESAIAAFRAADDGFGVLLSHPYLGWSRLLQGDHDAAIALTDELLALASEAGVSLVRAYALAHSAFIHLSIGSLDLARTNMATALGTLEQSGDMQNLVITRFVNTALLLRHDDIVAAGEATIAMIDHALACDSTEWEHAVLALVAHVLAETGAWTEARALGAALDVRFPTWRSVLVNTSVDPGRTLDHVLATGPAQPEHRTTPMLLRMAKRTLIAQRTADG